MDPTITSLQLANGLQVLLKEIHTSPVISHWIWYRVGSRDEVPGITGVSHWIEHMQFKGTPAFQAGVLDRMISREGGVWNALTYLDWTTYFETMPADKIDLAIRLEADRMVNSLFTEAEVESERTVVIAERQGDENEPLFRLGEEVQAAAFRVHPYHHEVIGDLADLQSIGRQDLFTRYRTFYNPNNAVLAVAGDFTTGSMLERIRELFEPIPPGPVPPRFSRSEPSQNGERQVIVEGPGETTYVQLAYHAPSASHPDFFPFTVLDSLLSGPSSLNMFGGGISNKTSRLYRALVERELAVGITGGLGATIDPYLYCIYMTVHPERQAEEAIRAVEEQIQQLQETPPSIEEVRRAMKQARALSVYGGESISSQAFWLGFPMMFATYEWFTRYLDSLESVTPAEVQRIAQTYLRPQNRVTGIYIPNREAEVEEDVEKTGGVE